MTINMTIKLNLDTPKAYRKGIAQLRRVSRAKNQKHDVELTCTDPGKKKSASVVVKIDALTLYILGFQGANKAWFRFKGHTREWPYGATELKVGENYNDLGFTGQNEYKIGPKYDIVNKMSQHQGQEVNNDTRKSIVGVCFLVSEAVRFYNVEATMSTKLVGTPTGTCDVKPLHVTVTNWSKRGGDDGFKDIAVYHHPS